MVSDKIIPLIGFKSLNCTKLPFKFNTYNQYSFVEPGHKRTESNIVYFQDELKNNPDRYDQTIDEDYRDTSIEHSRYEELCRRPDPIVSF